MIFEQRLTLMSKRSQNARQFFVNRKTKPPLIKALQMQNHLQFSQPNIWLQCWQQIMACIFVRSSTDLDCSEARVRRRTKVSFENETHKKWFVFCSVWSEACGQPLGRTRLGHVETVQPGPDNMDNSAPYGPSREGHFPPLHTDERVWTRGAF